MSHDILINIKITNAYDFFYFIPFWAFIDTLTFKRPTDLGHIWTLGRYIEFYKKIISIWNFRDRLYLVRATWRYIYIILFLDSQFKSYYHSKDKMGSPSSSGSLLKVSIDIEIFCTYREYFLILRFQKKKSCLLCKKNIFTKVKTFHTFRTREKKNLHFYIKPRDLQNFHFLFFWPQHVLKGLWSTV